MSDREFGCTVLVIILLFVGVASCNPILGIGGWGPKNTHVATVNNMYVDISGAGDSRKSHYMIGTDKGVFEVQNSLIMWLWNADEIYSKVKNGQTYTFTTKGNKVVCWLFQEYPYVIKMESVDNVITNR